MKSRNEKNPSVDDCEDYETKLNLSSKYADYSIIKDDLAIDIKLKTIRGNKSEDETIIKSVVGSDSSASENSNDAQANDGLSGSGGEDANPDHPQKPGSRASKNACEEDKNYTKELQKAIDTWQQSIPKYTLGRRHRLVLMVVVLVIVILFGSYQLLPICKVFSLGSYQVRWHTLFQFLILVLPALIAALASVHRITMSNYDQTLESLSEEKQSVFKRSSEYRKAVGWAVVYQGLTIIATFIAAITAIPAL